MNQNYGEVFCEAVDEIIRKRLEGISYDSTVLCRVVDDSKREEGLYVVTHNKTTKFEAFSTITNYRNDDNVYVQIPNGDWNQQKIITAKKTDKNSEPYAYQKPFETLVDITGNLITTKIDADLTGLVANSTLDEHKSITLWTYNVNIDALSKSEGGAHAAYSRLGIQAGFKSLINPFYVDGLAYNVTSGDYGLRLIITAVNEKTSKETENTIVEYVLYLNCADMTGNPYDFQTYYIQEKVFDISQIGKIQNMQLEFYQTPGSFKSADGLDVPCTTFLGSGIRPNLYTNDVYISLGYDVNEFDSEQVHIYTLDSTTYVKTKDQLTNSKDVQLRWVHKVSNDKSISATEKDDAHKVNNDKFISVTEKDDLDYEIRWYRYQLGAPSADEYSGVYWNLLATQRLKTDKDVADGINTFIIKDKWFYEIKDKYWLNYNKVFTQDIITPSFFNTYLFPDITIQQEQIKAIVIYNNMPYRSNVLVCENEDQAPNKATIDAVQALSIKCSDDTYGNYRIYNHGNRLLDSAEASVERYFIPLFNSSFDVGLDDDQDDTAKSPELKEAEQVEWIIPTVNTMIELPKGIKYDIDNEGRAHIIIKGTGTLENNVEKICYQKYYIKNYYSQNNTNNIIQCKVTKNSTVYTATKELTFGVAGSTGTEYTFILDFDDGRTAINNTVGDTVVVRARLYNYQNKEEVIPDAVSWSWKNGGTNLSPCGLLSINDTTNTTCKIRKENDWNSSGESYGILQGALKWGDWQLYAYLPIPIRNSNDFAYISGTTHVTYDASGCLSTHITKNPYKVFDSEGKQYPISTWEICNKKTDESINYAPHLLSDKEGNKYLSPLKFYVENSCQLICIVGKNDKTIIWSQPILILHDKYGIEITNRWDGNLDVGTVDQGTILAPRLVAGKKNPNNTFSGVVLGDWEATNSDLRSGTGLFGYYEGEQSYGFRDDGTAFIGKTGVGRIEFDGGLGVIESSAYDAGQGMSINLTAGTISAHQFTLSARDNIFNATEYLRLTTNVNDNPLTIGKQFWVEWDGTLHATAGEFSGNITASKISGGTIDGSAITGGSISVPKENPLFTVDGSGYLKATGANITGTITAEGGKIGNWTISEGAISNGATTLKADGSFGSSNATITGGSLNIGSGQFIVDSKGNMTAESATLRGHVEASSGSVGGWHMYQGKDYNDKPPTDGLLITGNVNTRGWHSLYAGAYYLDGEAYWTVLDAARDNVIAVGIPNGEQFKNHNYAHLRITQNGELIIGGDNAPFKVDQDGSLEATQGEIGGWTIETNKLSSGNLILSSSTSGASISGGSSSGNKWKINADGTASFNNLDITGGSFELGENFKVTSAGVLTAKSGTLGGWTVDQNGLRNSNSTAVLTPTSFKLGSFSVSNSGAITAGSNFSVSSTGTVTAAIGTFGDGWYITSGALSTNKDILNLATTAYGLATMLFNGMTLINKSANALQIMGLVRESLGGEYYNEGIFMGRETCIFMNNFSAIYMSQFSEFIGLGPMYLLGSICLDSYGRTKGKTDDVEILSSDGKTKVTLSFTRGILTSVF